jgi:hypothetical protein
VKRLLLLPALLLLAVASAATGRGSLAYLRDGAAWVEMSEGGQALRLPNSQGAWAVTLNPVDGTAAYSVALAKASASYEPPPQRVYLSKPPYKTASPMPKPLDKAVIRVLAWGADGRALAAYGDKGLITAYDSREKRLHPMFAPYGVLSRNGEVAARIGERGIELAGPGWQPERYLITTGAPTALFNAMRAQASHKGVRELLASNSPDLYSNSRNWLLSEPALSPDGEALYFATNAGSGMGASGNTDFLIVKADTEDERLLVLGKLGTFFGRWPRLQVSPDGRKLLVSTSYHSSAVENPALAYAVDLVTQKSVELLRNDPTVKDLASLSGGECWLADSKAVALSAAYYRVPGAADGLPNPKYDLYIKDAASGRLIRRITGATAPSCGPQMK